jgi:hypothetical protein
MEFFSAFSFAIVNNAVDTVVDSEKWAALQAKVHAARLGTAFREFRKAGIEPILIKGWAAMRHYPADHRRLVGDIDLAVSALDHAHAAETCRRLEIAKLNIDLHKEFRSLDTVPWTEMFGRSQLVELNGEQIRLLSDEDHLRILCSHWLVDGGAYREKLWDIYYAVVNRKSDFDWSICLGSVHPNRREWVITVIAIAHKYLGLKVDGLPFVDKIEAVPTWIYRSIEAEWAREHTLEPILATTHDRRLLAEQITRRMPPNPIRSTIECDGELWGNRRFWYQFRVMARRSGPFIRDMWKYFRRQEHTHDGNK